MRVDRQPKVRNQEWMEGQEHNSTNARFSSRVGEIQLEDLYEPSSIANTENNKTRTQKTHFKDVCEQLLADHAERPKTRVVLQVVARALGLELARYLSNIILYFSGRSWLEARRDYAVLPENAVIIDNKGAALKLDGQDLTAKKLAERFQPHLYTISEDQSIDPSMSAVEMRYEVLPPRKDKDKYSIIYYVRRESERMPVIFLGTLLELIRPLIWGSKSQWNAIEVDIDRNTGDPVSCMYQSSNYTGDSLSFETTSSNDLHLPVKATRKSGKWSHTLYQKDNKAKTRDIEDPFASSSHPSFAFVNWSGGLDLTNATKLAGYSLEPEAAKKNRLYRVKDLPLKFLDIKTYRKEAIDLRSSWLKRRKTGHCYLYFPPRKAAQEFKVINLVSAQMPSLIPRTGD